MPIACRYKVAHGPQFCATDCPASAPCGIFQSVRVERPEQLPPAEARLVDVAVLDMNHGWPNLGHDSLVHAVLEAACDLLPALEGSGLGIRVLSYDVRRARMLPEPPNGRFALYLGSGGPAHLDPFRNDGTAEGSQGIVEDPSWEPEAFALFDRIQRHPEAALLGVCHSFGVMCRWAGVARAVLRGPDKGGKSTGVLENVLTPEAADHPWFGLLVRALPDGRRLRIMDNRLFDLIPASDGFPAGCVPIGYETRGVGGPSGNALTMLEFARDASGMPRMFGVNHHPEIVDRERQLLILEQKRARGEVSPQWHAERLEVLTRSYPAEDSERRLHLTSDFTLLGPLRFHLQRQLRRRAEALGLRLDIREERVLEAAARAPEDAAAGLAGVR